MNPLYILAAFLILWLIFAPRQYGQSLGGLLSDTVFIVGPVAGAALGIAWIIARVGGVLS